MITVEELKPRIRESRTNGTVLDLIQLANAHSVPMGEMFSLYSQATAEVNREAQPAEQVKSKTGEVQGQIQIEADPFDFTEPDKTELQTGSVELKTSLKQFAESAVNRGFHIFGLTPKDKVTISGSHGFKDSKAPSDPLVLAPWIQDPNRNIGIDLGASDLCVLDFDKPESIPAWLSETKTYKVRSAKGIHVYFRGARQTTKLFVDGGVVGDVKSDGGYVLSAGSVHPSGAVYTVIDDSPITSVPERVSELVKHDSERVNASEDGPPIPYGSHDTELFRIGCMLRNAGMNYQEIKDALINIASVVAKTMAPTLSICARTRQGLPVSIQWAKRALFL